MATIQVACKIPNGIIIEHNKVRAELKGANTSEIINGFGVTTVDADLFNAWMGIYKSHPAVKGGLIFAHGSDGGIKAQTKEHSALETGMEGMDQEKPGIKAKVAPGMVAQAA